jgi:hypothetical protein
MNTSLLPIKPLSGLRPFGLLSTLFVCVGALGFASLAHAAEDPCVGLTKVLNDRGQLMQHIQSFQTKRPTAQEACNVFTKLSKINVTTVGALDRDGAWCRAPDTLGPTLKGQQGQIDTAKANACKIAEQQKKGAAKGGAEARQPFGGTDEILGGAIKLPQGAL